MLLDDSEITIASLMADLPMKRSSLNQLRLQLLSLKEGLELEQNPAQTRTPVKSYVVGENETLPIVSVRLFRSANYWKAIADLNQIQPPYTIWQGQILQIPEINRG